MCYKHIILNIWIGKQAVIAYIYPLQTYKLHNFYTGVYFIISTPYDVIVGTSDGYIYMYYVIYIYPGRPKDACKQDRIFIKCFSTI